MTLWFLAQPVGCVEMPFPEAQMGLLGGTRQCFTWAAGTGGLLSFAWVEPGWARLQRIEPVSQGLEAQGGIGSSIGRHILFHIL